MLVFRETFRKYYMNDPLEETLHFKNDKSNENSPNC